MLLTPVKGVGLLEPQVVVSYADQRVWRFKPRRGRERARESVFESYPTGEGLDGGNHPVG